MVGTIIALAILSTPTANSLSACMDRYLEGINNNGSLEKQQQWSKELACRNGKDLVLELQSCYSEAEKESVVPFEFFIIPLLKLTGRDTMGADINRVITIHNSACPGYQIQIEK